MNTENTSDKHENEEVKDERIQRNRELITRAQSGDENAAETLIIENTALVKSLALKFKDRGTELEDLIQIGMIGMLKAINSFQLERGTAFSTYAVPLIVGEIRRHLRDDGLIRVSRGYKRTGITIMREKNRIMTEEGRDAGIAELAEFAGVSVEEAAVALDAMSAPISLSDFAYGEEDGTLIEDTLADKDSLEYNRKFFERMALREAISKMNEGWQKIVILRFFRNKTQQQVADILGLTQVKVSREEKKIVEFLRNELK